MIGLENISANNGWSISILGVSIVFSGLTLLSLTIAQLHKVLAFIEKKKEGPEADNKREHQSLPVVETQEDKNKCKLETLSIGQREIAKQFQLLSERCRKPLSLPELLALAKRLGVESPHSSISCLLEKKALVPDGEGYYFWNL